MESNLKAEKHGEELDKLEQDLAAQEPENLENLEKPLEETKEVLKEAPKEAPKVQEVEKTTPEESATSKEVETPETPEEDKLEPKDTEAGVEGKDKFSKEERDVLSEKTKHHMAELRKKARLADDLLAKDKRADIMEEVYTPLKEISEEMRELVPEGAPKLPWEDISSQRVGQWASKLMEDIKYSERAYPELNPDMTEFDDKLAGDILRDFRVMRKSTPDFRLKSFVDRRMRSIVSAKKEVLERTEAVAEVKRQKAEEALPIGVTPSREVATSSDRIKQAKSIDELEKIEQEIGISDRFK